MKLDTRIAVLGLVVLGLLTGCSPVWRVVRASKPHTLAGANNVAVEFDYSQLTVEGMPLDRWMEEKTAKEPEYARTWADLTVKFEDAVLSGLKRRFPKAHLATEGEGDVTLTFRPLHLRMGKYIGIAEWPTVMEAVIGARPAGAAEDTDEIWYEHGYEASIIQPSIFQHIGPVGHAFGVVAGDFLNAKNLGE